MATPRWPAQLPQHPIVGGWTRVPQDNRVTFQPAVGPPIVRRRATARTNNIDATFPPITDVQLAIFESFYEADLADGALHYLWIDPQSGTDFKWRIKTYSVESLDSFDVAGDAMHRLTMQIIRLPGAAV